MKRAILVHGWKAHPNFAWLPWLKRELRAQGFEVSIPELPDPLRPNRQAWVNLVLKTIGRPDGETVCVGHSLGCQTIMRAAELLEAPLAGAVFVAGFYKLRIDLSREQEALVRSWFEPPLNDAKIRQNLPRTVSILSDDDPFLPLEPNRSLFIERIGARSIVEPAKGHFTRANGVTELPSVLTAIDWILKPSA